MIELNEAMALVRRHAVRREAVRVPLEQSLGCVLSEDVAADLDSPPYDKALMDGYALIAADVSPGAPLKVLEEITAGRTPTQEVTPGSATRIMTGAPLPVGADSVVMIERTSLSADDASRVFIETSVKKGANILWQGEVMRRGDGVLKEGKTIRPMEAGLLAEVGMAAAPVVRRPSVAVLATGDELVGANEMPGPGQIRNSNGPMLTLQSQNVGASAVDLGICPDEPEALREHIERGLEHDILLLSGGVSAGVLDLVPAALKGAGVEEVFHKVKLKPGKPLWFGVLRSQANDRLVFGLPGNPVSSLVCFELFVRPAIGMMSGRESEVDLTQAQATLQHEHHHRGGRPTFFPAHCEKVEGRNQLRLLKWKGSADMRTLVDANGLACLPAEERHYAPGDTVDFLWFA